MEHYAVPILLKLLFSLQIAWSSLEKITVLEFLEEYNRSDNCSVA